MTRKFLPDNETLITAILVLTSIAIGVYFDIGTRWRLSETWECHQTDNNSSTTEKFGLFGSQTTLSTSGPYSGLQIFSSYSLNGKKVRTTAKSMKLANGEMKKLEKIQQGHIEFNITNITKDQLFYTVEALNKRADVQCKIRD
ncbi:hypothetical protein H3H36_15655 [Duganella sp. FT3S]|uniref:Uncharacterized protein n=1 Tax=Rugamonas fusca TaxID=2758568 RepID=A0A7W2EJ83_9BURK|nr:hypothetical protein [Rugamonas fusca]MBA5606792.1 hypothetical protein [Rugamonas fusca]